MPTARRGRAEAEPARQHARGGFFGAIAAAIPPFRIVVVGSIAWSMLMAASAAFSIWLAERASSAHLGEITLLFGAGGLLSFPVGLAVARLFLRSRHNAVFAATFLSLAVATIAATGFLFAMQFRLYYATWHAAPFSIQWVFQFVFTTLAALYQFLVLGVRLFFPLGLAALFAVSLWHARAKR